jgi:hypothetical protein
VSALSIGDQVVATTEDHPFWSETRHRWESAGRLRPGDLVAHAGGSRARVRGHIAGPPRWATAYNLSVEHPHTFHVSDRRFLVHNTCKIPRRPRRGETKGGPGRWMNDPQGGRNMRSRHARYEVQVTDKPRSARGYYVNRDGNSVQFDGYSRAGVLIEAKFWMDGGRAHRLLTAQSYSFGSRILKQARDQVTAANGTRVEWRVAGADVAKQLADLFKKNGIDIEVVHRPPWKSLQ